jgi:hypothetical protein
VTLSPANSDAKGFIDGEAASFREGFEKHPFELRHRLGSHPLFELPRLMQLVRTLADKPDEIYFDAGDVGVDQRWDQVPLPHMTVVDALDRIEKSGAWIIVRHSERDPEYASLLRECIEEFEERTGFPIRREMLVMHAIIFISSPLRVTPYHIDRECNFILQIRGHKTISIFDRNDREVLPEHELERYWAVDNNAAIYKSQYQDRARVYELGPGDGVHVPVNCPHWVKNGDGISVTLSVNFWFRDRSRSDVYRANYFLRRLGFRPRPPGSPLRDAIKRRLVPGFDTMLGVRQRLAKRR